MKFCVHILIGLLLFYGEPLFALQCKNFLKLYISQDFLPQKAIRFMSLNTLNLYLHQGKYEWTDRGLVKMNQDHLPKQKPERHSLGLATAVLESQPDFLMLQEVEGYESLDRFNRRFLGDAYQVFMPQTNDTRGIGVAFLVRKGMGVTVKRRSYTKRKWTNKKGVEEAVFSRNFPIFEIYLEGMEEPKLLIAGVHYKSRADRPNDPKSFYKRQKEVDESISILKKMREQYPQTPMVVLGDFNSSPEQKELASFYNELGMMDAHSVDSVFKDPDKMGRYTFVYFPFEKRKKMRAFDQALLSANLSEHLVSSSVYRYKSPETGAVLPFPKNIEERNQKPSDHYPILFDLDADVLYSDYSQGD